MLIKQVMARPVPTHPKWKYSLNRERYDIFFSQENIIWRQCGLCGRLATIKKKNGIFYHISSNPLQNEVSI